MTGLGSRLLVGLVVTLGLSPVLSAPSVPLDEIRQVLREGLLTPPSERGLAGLDGADLDSGLRALDPHARYFPAGAAPGRGHAEMAGIGAELAFAGDRVLLLPYQGGGSDRAGVPDRATLIAVDGMPVAGLSPPALAQVLRGEPGTRVRLSILDVQGWRREVLVERSAFKALDVELVRPGDQRVIRIRQFDGGLTRSAFLATLDYLRDLGMDPARNDLGIVVDLRDAIGGDLFEAFDLAGLFVPEGRLLGTLVGRDGARRDIEAPGGIKLSIPLTLLVGAGTASAAEVFAGVLQQYGRAFLVGQVTHGKCSSQTDARLSDGSLLRFTNLEVLLPDGRSCSGKGVVPDVEVSDLVLVDLNRSLDQARAAGR